MNGKPRPRDSVERRATVRLEKRVMRRVAELGLKKRWNFNQTIQFLVELGLEHEEAK